MFGYIKIHKSELKVKEYELYKGLYCSLCKQLGKDYGFLGRMTLNYDFTFFLLCRMSIKDDELCFSSSHCSFNPRKKCVCCKKDTPELVYTAALSMLFAFYKIKDDITDGRISKKFLSLCLYPLFKAKYKKAKKKFSDIFQTLESELSKQNQIEKKENASLDECADPSGKVLGKAFSYMMDEKYASTAYFFGYNIGRLVYIFDAVDDYEKDLKNKSFNPFLSNREKYNDDLFENLKMVLNISADETAKIYESLPQKRFKAISDNVIYYGFEDTINRIFEKKGATL